MINKPKLSFRCHQCGRKWFITPNEQKPNAWRSITCDCGNLIKIPPKEISDLKKKGKT